jgi:hypothetical protein
MPPNFRYWGQSGHGADLSVSPLMTQSKKEVVLAFMSVVRSGSQADCHHSSNYDCFAPESGHLSAW